MSNNPQWKMFQPPESHSSPLHDILDLQHPSMQSKQAYRNGSYSGEYPSSPRDTYNNGVKASGGGGGGAGGGRYSSSYMDGCPMGDASYSSSGSGAASSAYDSSNHPPIRETGIIEKLLHSYGFIQCCERQARLFFHFSQFSGNTEHLKIGDPVEFEMTYDRRTGKPIASTVTKIAPEVVLSEARVTGTVTTEVKGEGSGDNTGRISYENRGECFFLPYTKDDVEGNVVLRTGDAVSFQIATNQRGTLGACHVRFENPQHPVKYHGVVCSMKDNFGFIERADVVKEIFFHFSETKNKEELALGDDVEFLIQTRNGKEVACNICKLPSGSVVFEDVSPDTLRGQVLKPLERGGSGARTDPLPGRIRYRAPDHSEVEVPFGDKDQCGEFTLRHGDWVRFQVATDRRDRLRRATNIALLEESFSVSGERRERGIVRDLRDGYGFLRCVERDRPMLFRFEEVLRTGRELSVGDEVEFTVDPPATFANCDTRQCAIRIEHLPPGSVAFETLVERAVRGAVIEDCAEDTGGVSEPHGLLVCQLDQARTTLPFRLLKGDKPPRQGDKVTFDVYRVKRTKELIACNVVSSHSNSHGAAAGEHNGAGRAPAHGYIAALKDGFGFIETIDHSKEVFFHFSNLEGVAESLELGGEVEYCVGRGGGSGGGGGCASAEWVRPLPRGTLRTPRASSPPLTGTVARTLRALNPDQAQYCGLVRADSGQPYEFGITGLACKREILQVGDPVTFQVDEDGRAANIVPVRKKRRATVDAIKGCFGFLSLAPNDPRTDLGDGGVAGGGVAGGGVAGGGGSEVRRLFFHMSEVLGPLNELQPGDTVEFVMLTNPRNGKCSACNVVKIPRAASKARPERLLARIRTASLEDGGAPRVIAIRAPRGPDGTRGFRPRRARAD